MGILLGFLPFIAFSLLDDRLGPTKALAIGAAIALVLSIRAWRQPPHSIKILEGGTTILMGGLALYTALSGAALSLVAVRLCVDAGLLLIVLVSMAIKQPFTIQYARQEVDPKYWNSPGFLRTNYVITGAWAAAFAVMVVAEAVMAADADFPRAVGFGVVIAALLAALGFTIWRSRRARSMAE
ncbi:hypothetical protein [Mesorhizobium sp.]|uniref:hypothetical protein n=1 Tax=Mesorhizobium sp. TaxID=1871066 RepID=UPI003BA8E778